MGRYRKGAIIQKADGIYARVRWTGEDGKQKEKAKKADNSTHANDLIKKMLREIDDYGPKSLDAERMTFADLADYYRTHHLQPAKYINGRKIAGLRSLASVTTRWATIRDYFGKKRLRAITYSDLARFRSDRLDIPTVQGRMRSVTSVNRELEILRSMLNVAYREGWIHRNPFNSGPPIIQKSHEVKRERIITFEEEERLLAACFGLREHLKPILIMALDTGMRKGEILSLTWNDINLAEKKITIQAFNTKTQTERILAMTPRLHRELEWSREFRTPDTGDRVFGIIDNVKKAFTSACKLAGIESMRLHDCRHTFATRLIEAGVPQAEVSRLLGHATTAMTDRYINADIETARRAAGALEGLQIRKADPRASAAIN